MKGLCLLISVFLVNGLWANPGDTTRVRSHNQVLIQTDPSQGHTEYSAWAQFPKPDKTFHKMYAELTFQCPPGMTCGEWDYLNYIFIGKRRGTHNDTLNWEVIRFITPYGLQFAKDWKHTWKFDITDFANLFQDSVEIWYQHTGYEARNGRGWLITVDFTMIEGTPIRPVNDIKLLWRKSVGYSNPAQFDTVAPEVNYVTGSETKQIRYKILQTGHGADQPDGCGEFCAKLRYLRHDGETDTSLVWRDDCGENPVFPQGGTWIYDRANWCPGAEVWEYNLDKWVEPKSAHKMDLDMQAYTPSSGGGNYMITAYLIEYGKHNFSDDASVEAIISPTSELQYKRRNPSCGVPRIIVRNNGSNAVKHLLFDYGWKGSEKQRFTWNGNMPFGDVDTIDLPYLKSTAPLGTAFECNIIWVNGKKDDYLLNNKISSMPTALTPELPAKIEILLRTNNAASENYYTLTKSDGSVIRNKRNFANNKIYRDTVQLEAGCYLLNLMDDGLPPPSYALNEDGLSWWANTADGSGVFQIRNPSSNSVIQPFSGDFGTGIWYQFHVGGEPSPVAEQPKLLIYPNPVHDDILIDLGKNTDEALSIKLYNFSGQLVLDQVRTGFLDALQYVDMTMFTNGMYTLKITVGDRNLTEKIIVN